MEISEASKQAIAQRMARLRTAVELKEGDRVPFIPKTDALPVTMYGLSQYDWMKDPRNALSCVEKYLTDYQPDVAWSFGPGCIIDTCEVLGATGIRVPGPTHGLPMTSSFQMMNETYLLDEEFGEYLDDPTHFMLTKVYPRKFKNLEGLSNVSFHQLYDLATMGEFCAMAAPPVGKAVETLLQAGRINARNMGRAAILNQKAVEMGFPVRNVVMFTPFDLYADSLRGLIRAVMDIKEFPDEVKAVTQRIGKLTIDSGIARAKAMGETLLYVPLHAGVDEFMSGDDYAEFYWPGLREIIDKAIAAGLTPYLFCEGKYNTRFDFLKNVPPKKVIYMFEQVDIARAKRELEGIACICGNLSSSLLCTGTPEKVADATKRMLDTCAPGGGFIMDCSSVLSDAKRENFDAWYETTMTYGCY